MLESERRSAPRFRISIPVRFQLAGSPQPEREAETLDLSSHGTRMETEAALQVGAAIKVCLRMPEMIMGWRTQELRILGTVIHIGSNASSGKQEIGVQFHYYEAAAPLRNPFRLMAQGDGWARGMTASR